MNTTHSWVVFALLSGCNQGVFADTDTDTDTDGSLGDDTEGLGETEHPTTPTGGGGPDPTSGPGEPTASTGPTGPNDAACGIGSFETPWDDCGTQGALQGTLRTSIADIEAPVGSAGVVTLRHRQDIDEVDDGCITDLHLELTFYSCVLELLLQTDGEGRARLRSASFTADSMCPGFIDGTEGEYAYEGLGDWWPLGIPPHVQDRNAAYSCLESSNWCFPDLEIPLFKRFTRFYTADDLLTVNLGDVTLTGSFASEGFVVEGEGAPACRKEEPCDHHSGGAWCEDDPYVCIRGFAAAIDDSECMPCSLNGTMAVLQATYNGYGYCLDDTDALAGIAQTVGGLSGSETTTVAPDSNLHALSVFEVLVPGGEVLRVRSEGVDAVDGYGGLIWVGERGAEAYYQGPLEGMSGYEQGFFAPPGVETAVDVVVFVDQVPPATDLEPEDLGLGFRLRER